VSKDVTGQEIVYDEADLAEVLSPRHFVDVRKTYGGPAPSETLGAIEASETLLTKDTDTIASLRAKIVAAHEELRAAVADIAAN
jgi:hypothetical protein